MSVSCWHESVKRDGASVKRFILILLLLLHAIGLPAQATKHRGVWFWREAGSPWGSDNIVGVPALENQTISFLSSKSVRRVYGSYGDRPVTRASVIVACLVAATSSPISCAQRASR